MLTDKQKIIIQQCWQSYDSSMSDPWRNDFYDDGQQADEDRWDYMIQEILEQMPNVSLLEIEDEIDKYR